MNILEIIDKKKNKKELSREEIDFFVNGYTYDEIPDYQVSALLMAILLNGMTDKETFDLTSAMLKTGKIKEYNFSKKIVDKHSTGGVSDSTTFIVVPVLACFDLITLKMSGRGLGFTGGTIDKLESIKGFNPFLTNDEVFSVINKCNACIIGQSEGAVPADKKLYALRDVTGTVDSIPLIASSIMSKKLASGADIIVLDVKYGSGAFMKTKEDAYSLASLMVKIGESANKLVSAVITDMNEPLGEYVGNTLDVFDAVNVLKGNKNRLYNVSKKLCSEILCLSGICDSEESAGDLFEEKIQDKSAFNKFIEMIALQGGDVSNFDDEASFFKAKFQREFKAKENGYLEVVDCAKIGQASVCLGAGRMSLEDKIDYDAGIFIKKRNADKVNEGETIFVLYSNDEDKFEQAIRYLDESINIRKDKFKNNDLIYKTVK